jgi:nucleoside-diphosphate-sugar epimerase
MTGTNGFIGSVLSEKLVERNHEVYGLCRNVTDRQIRLRGVYPIFGDITDAPFINKIVSDLQPDVVVHLAAPSSVAYSHEHVLENLRTTCEGTINLQKACLQNSNLWKFIFAGTSEEYGNQSIFPISESAPLLGNQPYSIAKIYADQYLHYCKASLGFPSIIVRPFNTYGRTKNFTFVTEKIISQMLSGNKIYLGLLEPTRDLLYVEDHIDGYIKAIESSNDEIFKCRAINLCTGVENTIGMLLNKISKILNWKGEVILNVQVRPTEVYRLLGDYSLAYETLGWYPKVRLEEGLKLTINKIKELKCGQPITS